MTLALCRIADPGAYPHGLDDLSPPHHPPDRGPRCSMWRPVAPFASFVRMTKVPPPPPLCAGTAQGTKNDGFNGKR